jgi:20S proteasome alpha/beta subunit
MSLGIAFKGPEGIVLAADSRVTLTAEMKHGNEKMTLPSTFDNATKLLKIAEHNYIGVVTYGVGAIGQQEPRTAHSF